MGINPLALSYDNLVTRPLPKSYLTVETNVCSYEIEFGQRTELGIGLRESLWCMKFL